MTTLKSFDISALRASYQNGLTPSQVVAEVFRRISKVSDNPAWIHLLKPEQVFARARELEKNPAARDLPLYGIPFAVKDNIDVAGLPTTAACPAFASIAIRTATAVDRLLRAGAILIGKTNLDQFATGLVGTRSPYGACHSVFDARYISGGSSSGSAVVVASGLVSFALGTDTAGSGRVPAAFNNLVGLKPTRGRIPASDVVPACQSLDCVSVFALNCTDAAAVLSVAEGYDAADPYSRASEDAAAPWAPAPRIGVPKASQLKFFDDPNTPGAFDRAVRAAADTGATTVEIDFEPFRAAAELLYAGPWVAEREAAVGAFRQRHSEDMDPVVAQIIGGGATCTAVEAYRGQYRLQSLMHSAREQWNHMDVLMLPTAGTTYTLEQIASDPIKLNSNLGFYTNFLNLMDLAAVAVPAGFLPTGLPFGITLVGPAFSDKALLGVADRLHRVQKLTLGATEVSCAGTPPMDAGTPGSIRVAVVGAHLSGQPLNYQLQDRGARLLRTCRTGSCYRLYEIAASTPRKPGLVYEPSYHGPGIEVEVWAIPLQHFGTFVDTIPAPLGIGKITLEDGTSISGFICEPRAIAGATEITQYGSWRNWLAQPV